MTTFNDTVCSNLSFDKLFSSDSSGEEANASHCSHQAVVVKAISANSKGRVRFRGSEWPARTMLNRTLLPGEVVQVQYRRNLTLYVDPPT